MKKKGQQFKIKRINVDEAHLIAVKYSQIEWIRQIDMQLSNDSGIEESARKRTGENSFSINWSRNRMLNSNWKIHPSNRKFVISSLHIVHQLASTYYGSGMDKLFIRNCFV